MTPTTRTAPPADSQAPTTETPSKAPSEARRETPSAGAAEAGEGTAPCSARERYIPVPKREILTKALADPRLAPERRSQLEAIGRRLALIFHVEFHGRRERLKDAYVRLNPDQPGEAALPSDPSERQGFLDTLDTALARANFSALDPDAMLPERDGLGRVRVKVRVPHEVFEQVRFYARGRRRRHLEVKTWFGLRTLQGEATVWDYVVLVAAIRGDADPRALKDTRLRPGGVYLKLFRDIPAADLETLYPNARVVMDLKDKLILGVPAVVGGVPILLNLLPTLTVLFLVAGFYLGISGTVEADATKQALAALSGLGALGGFLGRQWIKYERQKLKYQKQVSDNAYFNSLSNNAGFFDWLVGTSEDSEVKEAFLAYWALLLADRPLSMAEMDAHIETWLTETFRIRADFEEDDALAKLERLGLVEETGDGRLQPVAPDLALERLEAAWVGLSEAAFNGGESA